MPSAPDVQPIRLLSVIHGPAFGGAHNQAVRLAEPLRRRRIETIVVLPDEAEGAAQRMRAGGLEVLTMPLSRLRASANPVRQLRFAATVRADVRRLRRLIIEHSIDLVQAHGVSNPQPAWAARSTQAAISWQLLDSRAPMALRHLTMPMVTRLADSMTSWGQGLADEYPGASKLADRMFVVFPPVDASEVLAGPSREAAREELDIPNDALALGSLGVLNPQKGHEYTIRAAAMLSKKYPGLRTTILGTESPGHPAYLAALKRERAELFSDSPESLGFVDPGNRPTALLGAFDIFVMAAVPRSEGMPTAILEAMVHGLPVIATDVGAVRELVDDGTTGLLVDPEDPGQLAAAISRLIDDPALRRQMGEAASARAADTFEIENLAEIHADAYRTAVEFRQRRQTS